LRGKGIDVFENWVAGKEDRKLAATLPSTRFRKKRENLTYYSGRSFRVLGHEKVGEVGSKALTNKCPTLQTPQKIKFRNLRIVRNVRSSTCLHEIPVHVGI